MNKKLKIKMSKKKQILNQKILNQVQQNKNQLKMKKAKLKKKKEKILKKNQRMNQQTKN